MAYIDGVGHERAARRAETWAAALQAYRASVDLYRQVLNLRVQRPLRPEPQQAGPLVTIPEGPTFDGVGLASLTAREREVACLIALGYTNQQIAESLVVTRGTVANHVAHILSKLGAANRTQVAAHLVRELVSAANDSVVSESPVELAVPKVG